jgi:hypothetical protein
LVFFVIYIRSKLFSGNGQVENILGFVSNTALVAITQLCPYSSKAATDNISMNVQGGLP